MSGCDSDRMETDDVSDFLDFYALPEEVLMRVFACFSVLDLSRTALVSSDVRFPFGALGYRFLTSRDYTCIFPLGALLFLFRRARDCPKNWPFSLGRRFFTPSLRQILTNICSVHF